MFERIKLPYAYDALEPYIDAETVKTHYEAHHKTYTDKFNDLVAKVPDFKGMEALEILKNVDKAPSDIRQALINNGGGYYNHNLYFESLTPDGNKPTGELADLIEQRFGGVDACLKELNDAALNKLFGSGWSWLVLKDGKLDVLISGNQDLPEGNPTLLLPLDMWEHAYYLRYKNKKPDYLAAFNKIINWDIVNKRMENKN